MKSFFRALVLLAVAGNTCAIEPPPVLLILLDLSRDIARLLDRAVSDPAAFLASLFERAGIAHSINAQGLPRLP